MYEAKQINPQMKIMPLSKFDFFTCLTFSTNWFNLCQLFFSLVLQSSPPEIRSARNFFFFWSTGFRVIRSYEKFFFGVYSLQHTCSSFLTLTIVKQYGQNWGKIFPEGVPFVCWSKFFQEIFIFSWTLKILVCFSFCMFVASANRFWEILSFL